MLAVSAVPGPCAEDALVFDFAHQMQATTSDDPVMLTFKGHGNDDGVNTGAFGLGRCTSATDVRADVPPWMSPM
ncbi:MAG: hypothetical protein ACLFUJ_15995 [Phycisphaerae bacterium]